MKDKIQESDVIVNRLLTKQMNNKLSIVVVTFLYSKKKWPYHCVAAHLKVDYTQLQHSSASLKGHS